MALTNDFRQKIQDGATTSSGSVQNNQPLDTKGFNEWVNPTPKASVVTQVKDIGNQMGNTYQETAKNTIENAKTALGPSQTADTGSFGSNFLADLSKRLSATGHIAGDIAGAALAPVMHTITALIPPEIKKDSEAAVNWVADKITNSPQITEHLNKINNALDANPDLKKSLMSDLPNALALLGGNKVNELNPEVNMGGVTKDLGTIKDTIGKVPSKVQGAIDNTLKTDGSSGAGNIKLNIAKGNVNPQLESSAGRLSGDNPVASYDTYLSQSKNALKDIKADPAISSVGEKIGNAFESVIKERSNVGKTLGDELKTVGKNKVSITEPKTNLLSELKDSGLSYNPKTKQLTSFQGSKFASDEVAMLDNYQKGVNALGDTPTVSQIDNFISKTRTELDLAKGKSGVTGATNAERIIKGNLAKLRESLDPSIPGNEALSKYWEANKKYSDLSDFIEEGSGFLGKKTQSGDFAKDASMAKSSVQSILNNGKKDWMARLEDLTGYKAIDDSVLALQAMKDAGDFRGLSLLQTMSESGIPTSKAGFAQKVIDFVAKKGGELIAGTPEEQTRAFLKDLVEKQGKADLKGKGTIPENSLGVHGKPRTPFPTNTPEFAAKQAAAYKKIDAEFEKLIEQQKSDSMAANDGTYVINPDDFKPLVHDTEQFGKYNPIESQSVHEPASELANLAKDRAIDAVERGDTITWTAGGPGNGKGTAISRKLPDLFKDSSFAYDSVLGNPKKALADIQRVLDAGGTNHIAYVFRNIEDAWVDGIVKRALSSGRTVSAKVYLQGMEKAWSSIQELHAALAEDSRNFFSLLDNTIKNGDATFATIEDVKNLNFKDLESKFLDKLENIAKDMHKEGALGTGQKADDLLRGLLLR